MNKLCVLLWNPFHGQSLMEKIWLEFWGDIQFLEVFGKLKVHHFDWFSKSSPVGCSGNYPQCWLYFLEDQCEAYMKLNSHIRTFGGKIQEKYLSISIYCGMIIFTVSRELGSEFKTITDNFSYYELRSEKEM